MNEWFPCIASICLGGSISILTKMPPILSGMFCLGLNIIFTYFSS